MLSLATIQSKSKSDSYQNESQSTTKNLYFDEDINSEWIVPPDKLLESLTIHDDSLSDNHEDFKSLEKLNIEDSASLLPSDVLMIVSECHRLQELSLPYSLTSDDLLRELCSKNPNLKMIKIEAFNESKPFLNISEELINTLENYSKGFNLVLMLHLSDNENYDNCLTIKTPLTHLYLNGSPPEMIFFRISENCLSLVELVISSFGPDTIDEFLILIAKKCNNLSAIALGDCELTCSGLVEFVTICKERIRILYVWETSLIEDNNLDIIEATSKVSSILGRSWAPEYIPPW